MEPEPLRFIIGLDLGSIEHIEDGISLGVDYVIPLFRVSISLKKDSFRVRTHVSGGRERCAVPVI